MCKTEWNFFSNQPLKLRYSFCLTIIKCRAVIRKGWCNWWANNHYLRVVWWFLFWTVTQLFLLKPKSEPLVEELNQASGNAHCSLAKKDKGPCSLVQCVCLCVKFSRRLLPLKSFRVKQTRGFYGGAIGSVQTFHGEPESFRVIKRLAHATLRFLM